MAAAHAIERGHRADHHDQLIARGVTSADLTRVPRDAESLNAWLGIAQRVLTRRVAKSRE
jgi:hypothetical protein